MDGKYLEKMFVLGIDKIEISRRKNIIGFDKKNAESLRLHSYLVKENIRKIIDCIKYELLLKNHLSTDFIASLKSPNAYVLVREYILQLCSGKYDEEYVRHRIEVGRYYKKMGATTDMLLASMHIIKYAVSKFVESEIEDEENRFFLESLDKILMLDSIIVLDTFICELVCDAEDNNRELSVYISELEMKIKENTKLVSQDPTTGLFNVRYMMDTLKKMMSSSKRRKEPLSCIYIDINSFKKINDTYGHCYGDEVLGKFGLAIKEISRAEDACFRCGGDEFCVFLPNCTAKNALEIYAVRLRKEIERRLEDVTFSVGVAQAGPYNFPDGFEIVKSADLSMYKNKRELKVSCQRILE